MNFLPKISPIEITLGKLPSGISAITLFPFIFYKHKPDECLRKHERFHWDEVIHWGWWNFGLGILAWYASYVGLWLFKYRKYPPHDHPMERKAYETEWECRKYV